MNSCSTKSGMFRRFVSGVRALSVVSGAQESLPAQSVFVSQFAMVGIAPRQAWNSGTGINANVWANPTEGIHAAILHSTSVFFDSTGESRAPYPSAA